MNLRDKNLQRLESEDFEVLVVGSGINGAVSACALAAHGIKTALIDGRDFAGFTSQQSSNLVWGGIKYMEGYEFGLVSELCQSRNDLLKSFPSTVREIRFLMTINKKFRFHPWIIYASTWLYWILGRGKTRIPRLLSNRQLKIREPVINTKISSAGVEYSDAFLHDNDARFVFNFVRNAMNKDCVAVNYLNAGSAQPDTDGGWITDVEDHSTGRGFSIRSKVLINATGAFVDKFNETNGIQTTYRHLLSKGIHLIVPRISQIDRVLSFFADDDRLIFAIPMANRTCIGTTDTLVNEPVTAVTEEDRDFVLSNINARLELAVPLSRRDIIAERCGVRPLATPMSNSGSADVQHLSRKHVIEVDSGKNHISIFGGKLTDCLNVGNEICAHVSRLGLTLASAGKWYGEPDDASRTMFFKQACRIGLDQMVAGDTYENLGQRLWRRYGADAEAMLRAIEQDSTLAEPVIKDAGIRFCELDYLLKNEMIVKLEDFLRRRSKVALLVTRGSLKDSEGLKKACEILFGSNAQYRYDEYFGNN